VQRLGLAEMESAAALVHGSIPPTPHYSWPLLNERAGFEVWVKHENHAPTGAFKVRGGLVLLDALRRLIGGHQQVSAEPLRVSFIGFGVTSLDVEINAYVETTNFDQFCAVREELFLRMIETIAECGTALARAVNVATLTATPASAPPPPAKDPRPG